MASGELTPVQGEDKSTGAGRYAALGKPEHITVYLTEDNVTGVAMGSEVVEIRAEDSPETHDALVNLMVSMGRDNIARPELDSGGPMAIERAANVLALPAITEDTRRDLVAAMGLLTGHGHMGSAAAVQRVLDAAVKQLTTEQEPVKWQFLDADGKWWDCWNEEHRKNTESAGFTMRALYAAPVQAAYPSIEVIWDGFVERIRADAKAKEVVNIIGSIKKFKPMFLAAAQPSQHPDDAAVDALAALMKAKLAKQREKGYGGWDTDCTRERLSELLRGHVDKGDPVDVANFCAFLSARGEGIAAASQAAPKISGGALDTLVALVERGPLDDGDVPSKAGRNELLELGLVAKVIVNGGDGWQAATYRGRDAYKAHFGTALGGAADTINEARSNRVASKAIRTASRQKGSQ